MVKTHAPHAPVLFHEFSRKKVINLVVGENQRILQENHEIC